MVALLRGLLAALLLPALLIDLLRWLRLRRRGVVEISLVEDLGRPGGGEHLAQVLEELRSDPFVRAVRLRLDGAGGSWAGLQTLHRQLRLLVEAGKGVLAEAVVLGTAELYLASAASRVVMMPAGEVYASGPSARLTFLGDALARLGVEVEVFAAGDYKTAGDPLVRACPTPEHREATQALLDDWYAELLQAVARGRELPPERVAEILALTPFSAAEAVEAGLVDALCFEDEVEGQLEDMLEVEPRRVSLGDWWRGRRLLRLRRWLAGGGAPVAVLRLRGAVVERAPTRGAREVIAADKVVVLLDRLREDDAIRGVLLCVDSPGGSALASERIARAVQRLQGDKPVVALLQGVAASGGYYIAVPAGVVYAQPGTVTGSIGVIGAQVRVLPALGRWGVHATALSTTPGSDLDLGLRAMTRPERARIEAQIERTYALFLQRVVAGRRRPLRVVEPLAGGRVWSGRAALRHGLLDRLGTYHDALAHLYGLLGLLPRPGFEPRLDLGRPEPGLLPRLARALLGGAMLRAWPGLGLLARLAEAAEPPAVLEAVLEAGARPAVMAVAAWEPTP